MYARFFTSYTLILCGNGATASALTDELVALADERSASQWKGAGMMNQGTVLALAGKATDARSK